MVSKASQNISKLRSIVRLGDFPGSDRTGLTDSTTGLVAAEAFLTAQGGGTLDIDGAFYIAGAHTIPDDIVYRGYVRNPGQRFDGSYLPTNYSSCLVLGGALSHGNRNAIERMVIIQKNLTSLGAYALPFASSAIATAAVAAFSGNAVQSTGYTSDFRMQDVLVLGFAYAYNGLAATGCNRPIFERVYGDCTNGIHLVNVFDWGRARQCEMWEFTTTNQAGVTTTDLITRTGVGFYTGPGSTWMLWDDCDEFGWAVGHDINGSQDVRHINCGADGPVGAATATKGFRYRGSIGNAVNKGCTATAQSDTGAELNADPQNGVNHITLDGFTAHGNNSSNGYVHVKQGTYAIIGSIFIDNSTVGHIKLDAGVQAGLIDGCAFANLGAQAPVFGDATAVAKAIYGANVYPGSSTGQPLPSWTPTLTFGGNAVGLGYATQLGSFQVNGRTATASFKIILNAVGSSTGVAAIGGLPLTVSGANGAHGGGAINYAVNMAGLTGALVASGNEGTSTLSIYQSAATGVAALTNANFTNSSTLYGTVTYTF